MGLGQAGKAVNYRGAGTVEFLYDGAECVYFMEMNTRLQVEHPVSEMVTGQDFVEWQLRIVAGEGLPLGQDEIRDQGHAFESRLYAEPPNSDFSPSVGQLTTLRFPENGARIDSGVEEGQEITPYYDPMIAKIITHGASRTEALGRIRKALVDTHVAGLETNASFLHTLASHKRFIDGDVSTRFIDNHSDELFTTFHPTLAVWAAAVLWKTQRTFEGNDDPWTSLTGFQLNRPQSSVIWIEYDRQPSLLTLQHTAQGFDAWLEPDASAAARRDGRPLQEPVNFSFDGEIDSYGRLRLRIGNRIIEGLRSATSRWGAHLD